MALLVQDMWYSYEPFQTASAARRLYIWRNAQFQVPHYSSRIVGRFHERLVEIITAGENIWSISRDDWDIRLKNGKILEVKAGHYRYPYGRKNWVFGPTQLDSLKSKDNLGDYYLALFCYWIENGMFPEPATIEYGKYVVRHYTSNFLIFMKYADCLLLDQQGKITTARSGWYSRKILLFRHVLELAQTRALWADSQLFSNIDIPPTTSMVPLIGKGARLRTRNVLLGIDVNPLEISDTFSPAGWSSRFGVPYEKPVL
jgi:hypothetical protein